MLDKKFTLYTFYFCLLTFTLSFGQIDYDFSGYVNNFSIYQKYNKTLSGQFKIDDSQFLNLSRARLRPVVYLTDNLRINIEYEILSLYNSSSGDLFQTVPQKSSRQLFDWTWTPVNEANFSISHFIDRLYLKYAFKNGNVTIGRQRVSWGTGRIWNPTDLFNPINPATFFKIEKDGADIIAFKYFLGNFTDLHLVFNPDEKIGSSNFGGRFRSNIGEYDFSFMGGSFDERIVTGADFAGNLFGAGIRGEGIFSADDDNFDDNFIKYILGIDAQVSRKLYLMLEYQFNGEGKTNKVDYELNRLFSGEIINLSKSYLHFNSSYQYHPLLTITFSSNTNLNDGSGYLSLVGDYSAAENFYINLGSQFFYGSELSEYWYYSTSIYLQGEYYF
ncbi:MAG: hypothetical protein PVH88_13550 [Ignavibacteria bacterium]|jgi:hypothetical protein